MKLIITLLALIFTVSCTAQADSKQQQNTFILNNINIVDVANKQIRFNKSILVKDGKFKLISDSPIDTSNESSNKNSNQNIKVIDGNGGYVTPGLIDMHVHMYEKAAFTIAMSHGVTHVRIMNGVPDQLAWREQLVSGELIGSTATVSSPIISAYEDAYLHHTVKTAEHAEQAVKQYQQEGYDLIKAYGNLSEESLTALISAAKTHNIPIAKHGPHASGEMPLIALLGFQSFEHVEEIYQGPLNYKFTPEKLLDIAQQIKATNVPVTPTLNIYDQLTQLSDQKETFLNTIPTEYTSDIIALEASKNQVKRWLSASNKMAEHNKKTLAFLQQITRVFHDAGISLLVGSDSGVLLSPHGLATHNEMRLMHEAGISTYDVLAAATINPAKALELDSQIGSILENYNADFILSKTNPITNLSALENPDAVAKNGTFYPKETLEKLRNDAIEARSFWQELATLFEAL